MNLNNRIYAIVLIMIGIIFSNYTANSQSLKSMHAREVIHFLYTSVSFSQGGTPNYNNLKKIFHSEANIVVRKSKNELKLLSLDEFIALWKSDILKYKIDETGFSEKIVSIKTEDFGDIAYGHVIYQASVPNSEMAPRFAIDCIHLVKIDEKWKIISIINEALRPGVEPFSLQRKEFNNYINKTN